MEIAFLYELADISFELIEGNPEGLLFDILDEDFALELLSLCGDASVEDSLFGDV